MRDKIMFDKLYTLTASAYSAVEDFKRDPLALVKKLERGDADSSGSTLRTVGIVVLVVLVVGVIGVAVYTAASGAANSINKTSFDFTP
ncbi:MAG: hypothetical protein M1546_14850 [Chloroflexi bacterium]|nr:hypothetical protein [Chloroflexota bacterium]